MRALVPRETPVLIYVVVESVRYPYLIVHERRLDHR